MRNDSLIDILRTRFAAAIAAVTGQKPEDVDPQVRPAGDPQFGDYQCNVAMSLARTLKSKPRDVAQRIKSAVEPALADLAAPLEIAGPGFINIRLKPEFLAEHLGAIPAPPGAAASPDSHLPTFSPSHADADRVGIPPVAHPQRVIVEYSQPNIAKQMHVGHLRSTIIGDVFARVLAFQGHDVIRQNHIGDWGTQFGMLIRYYREHPLPTPEIHADVLEAIEHDYKAANERFGNDARFADEARRAVGELQSGDPEARSVWQAICAQSYRAFTELYQRLGVLLQPGDICGESFYNDRLKPLVEELTDKLRQRDPAAMKGRPWAEVRVDQGAVCVFLYDEKGESRFKTKEGDPLPMIIQKSDGAYLYATTDLAAIRYRLTELAFPTGVGAQRIIYVTDARQKLHFQMFFATARAAGWVPPDAKIEHVTFGAVLGDDRRPLKTRTGGTIKLRDLLDEAEKRALALLEERDAATAERKDEEPDAGSSISGAEKTRIAQRVGIAAVKYADLRGDRESDYVFNWDKMLAMQGNTAPYMMYAYARIRSIYRKAAERFGNPDVYAPAVHVAVTDPTERALALRLARLRETIDTVAADLEPHTLCTYLYNLASDFMRFYEACPVLQAADEPTRLGRMRLCDLAARTLRLGLSLLGIEALERM